MEARDNIGSIGLTDCPPIDILSTKTSNETRCAREKKMMRAFAAVPVKLMPTVWLALAFLAYPARVPRR
jgi:hypothetical protein